MKYSLGLECESLDKGGLGIYCIMQDNSEANKWKKKTLERVG